MKLVYAIQEDHVSSNRNIKGIFFDANNALIDASRKVEENEKESFRIIEFPINKSVDGGIVIYQVQHDPLKNEVSVYEINDIYSFGGIKKWTSDQEKAAKRS
jgi:hypothetical protein